jgi:ACDE family multidrug resistance protein
VPPAPLPSRPLRAEDFALLFGLDSAIRGLLLSVMPLVMFRAWGDGTVVSAIYLGVGVVSLAAGLLVPWASTRVPRGRLARGACVLYVAGMGLLVTGNALAATAALLVNAVATATLWVCLSAYVLDHVPREALGRAETKRLLYSAAAWTAGPVTGVLLLDGWRPAPFAIAAAFAGLMLLAMRRLRLGDGKPVGAAGPRALGYLARFLRRPRLVAGWIFAMIRSAGWWVYIVYLPLFCIQNGLGETVGGAAVSGTSLLLFATPWLLRLVQRWSVRGAVRGTFGWCAALFGLAGLLSPHPWATVACLVLASLGLVMLDVCGSLPFLMAVKPSERTEMAAVYSSFRDMSGIVTPAVGGLILLVAPVAAVFGAAGLAMGAAWAVAATVHPRLGQPRPVLPRPVAG